MTNGNGSHTASPADEAARALEALSPERRALVEASNLQFLKQEQTIEEQRQRIGELESGLKLANLEIDRLQSRLAEKDSDVASAKAEKDEAVAQRYAYETLVFNVGSMIADFRPPAKPVRPVRGHTAKESLNNDRGRNSAEASER